MGTREVMFYEIVNDLYQVYCDKLTEKGWSESAIELYCLCHQTTVEIDAQVLLGTMSDEDIEKQLYLQDLFADN